MNEPFIDDFKNLKNPQKTNITFKQPQQQTVCSNPVK